MTEFDDTLARQRGVISRSQAIGFGLTPDAVRGRLQSGRWRRLFAGVYATTPGAGSPGERRWGAVLRAGPGAILLGRSAAAEVGLLPDDHGLIEVAVPSRRRVVAPPGMLIRRSVFTEERRHPCRFPPQTRVEETVLDLGLATDPLTAMGWITEAWSRRLVTPQTLAAALDRRDRVPGKSMMSGLISDASQGCRSLLDWLYLDRVQRAHGLPASGRPDELDVTAVLDQPCRLAREIAVRAHVRGWQDHEQPCGSTRCDIAAIALPPRGIGSASWSG